MPITKTKLWLDKEKELGCLNPDRAVLATATTEAIPHSRVVAIREISEEGLLFFTQRGTRKFIELMDNPKASMTFWFELQQRQVIIEGTVNPLTAEANHHFWKTMPRDRQLSDCYCGFMLVPETFYFYIIRTETFSEVLKYEHNGSAWTEKMLSP